MRQTTDREAEAVAPATGPPAKSGSHDRPHPAHRKGDPDRRGEADALRLAITRTARRLRQEAGGGLSPTMISALASIERHQVLTPGELARIEGVQRPTATRVVAKLLDGGMIDRREDPDDRRSVLLSVSDQGHRYLAGHRSRKSAWLATLIEELPGRDARTLTRAAEILSAALEGHRTEEIGLPAEDDPFGGVTGPGDHVIPAAAEHEYGEGVVRAGES